MSRPLISQETRRMVPVQLARPARLGDVPPLAAAFSPRPETGLALASSLSPGEITVLCSPPPVPGSANQPAAGGTGKTQLAAALAHSLWQGGAVDLLIWLTASSRDAITTGYARGVAAVGAGDPGGDAATAASRFLAWLAATDRPWLLVLDDLADPADLAGLLPAGPAGRVLVTSRLGPEALQGAGRRIVPIGPFSRREALSYLTSLLQDHPDQRIEALDLAEDLRCLPLALSHAAAAMVDRSMGCRDYRAQLTERRVRLTEPPDDDAAITSLTVSLALDYTDRLPPGSLARGALALTSVLDPAGIPGAVLTSGAALAFMTGQRDGVAPDPQYARAGLHNLARYGLVVIDPGSVERTVRVHPLVQAIVRRLMPDAVRQQAVLAAADALLETWQGNHPAPVLAAALRDNTASLQHAGGELLWSPEAHPVLLQAGASLDHDELAGPAIRYWQAMIEASDRALGPAHPLSLGARDRLAAAQEKAGRPDDAISSRRRSLEERERILGPGHPDTLAGRGELAHAYLIAGHLDEALPLYEQALAAREWALGPYHTDTMASRSELAHAYSTAGRLDDAIAIYERTLADRARTLGPDHPDTLTARASLAAAYRVAGRLAEAMPLYEHALAGREAVLGPDHPDTLAARASLAYAYRSAGKLKDAIPLYKRTLADRERVLGRDHPDTIASCGSLAAAYYLARRLKDAVPLYERALADAERVLGPDHPDTLTSRGNLASAYHSARRLADAIPQYERALTDSERIHGPDHPDTLTSRCNLANAYHTARRQADAIRVFERTLADCERVLEPGHPLTETVRESLAAATQA
jgi:tetratricopeptide (TPR) repeat protein